MGEDNRTTFSIVDEHDENSSITLDKWTSDILHDHYSNMHEVIQNVYDAVCKQNKAQDLKLSRRKRGNEVRKWANQKALKLEPPEFNIEDF